MEKRCRNLHVHGIINTIERNRWKIERAESGEKGEQWRLQGERGKREVGRGQKERKVKERKEEGQFSIERLRKYK